MYEQEHKENTNRKPIATKILINETKVIPTANNMQTIRCLCYHVLQYCRINPINRYVTLR